ncbi:MAG: glycosyltransferase family 2 protein [Limnochordia bacterium]|jgi:glycosyltransferase involved in cell wall biosynthesis|nr:glycosyltransferase family 2 protein [Bacillota bacterium]NLL08460.1 glycosyltransferase family 2 protein [Bacillota bacterium]HBG09082.1 glycosyl transferase [Bacillota bacterium]
MKVIALIPAYNEEQYIAETLEAVCSIVALDEVLVINDGSTDNTRGVVEKVRQEAPRPIGVLDLAGNQGKGHALNAGLAQVHGDIYLFLDADLGRTARYGQALVDPVLRGEAHMTVARFVGGQALGGRKTGLGLVRRLAAWGVKLLTGQKVSSPLSGQRAIRSEVLERLGELPRGFGVEVGLTVGALYHGFTVLELPLPMKHRSYGRGLKGFWHRGRQLGHVLRALWQCWQRGWHP